jgi:hypothetical protein
MLDRPVDVEQQRFAGDDTVDHAVLDVDLFLARADVRSRRKVGESVTLTVHPTYGVKHMVGVEE